MDIWEDKVDIKNQNFRFFTKGLKNLWSLLGDQKKNTIIIILCITVMELASLVIPFLLKLIFDEVPKMLKLGAITTSVIYLLVFMLLVKVAMGIFHHFVSQKIFFTSVIKLENLWPIQAQKKMLELSLSYHEKENTGKKIAKINKGCEKLVDIIVNLCWTIFPQALFMIINMIIVFVIDWRLGLLFFAPFIPSIAISIYSYKKYHPVWKAWDKEKEKASGLFVQSLINVSTVQSFVQEEREKKRLLDVRENMRKIDTDACIGIQKYYFLIGLILDIFLVATIGAGLYLVFAGTSKLGTIVYITTTGTITMRNMWVMINNYLRILRNFISVDRMKAIFNEVPDIVNRENTIIADDITGNISIDNITFTYPNKEAPVIKKMCVDFEAGKMTALVGISGAGKTTMINLIRRMYDVDSGFIKLAGYDIKDLDIYSYRRKFAVVSQNVEVFDDTIGNNIAYGAPNVTKEQIIEAISASHLNEILNNKERFPDGIDTQVGEKGIKLSGGERQRVGIGRALIAIENGAECLILDEATSNLDSKGEKEIQKKIINGLRKNQNITIIVIAHRLSTVKWADKIYVMENGEVVQKGDHSSLIAQPGIYQELVKLQQLA